MFDDGGSRFQFNMGGGPGVRVHQFGGPRPRRRPRHDNDTPQAPATLRQMIINLLPILFLLIVPLLSSLLSSSSGPEKPVMYFPTNTADSHHSPSGLTSQSPLNDFKYGKPPFTLGRVTKRWGVEYYLDPREVKDFTPRNFMDQDRKAEDRYSRMLRLECQNKMDEKDRMITEAYGLFGIFTDQKKLDRANRLDLSACNRLNALGYRP